MSGNNKNISAVFYAEAYHPIQAGSIDGTDILPHDNAVYRALLCSSAGLYDPFGDPKVNGDPYCTLFVGHLSRSTTEDTLSKAMSRYGRVKNLRLVRDIVTGASRGYAFVEFETDREMRCAYEDAHHSFIDDSEIIVDYNRQQLMHGWIPRRLGGGLGGKKESGQLRFGGRERPFRAPLRPIPYEDLKRLGIPPPPEGRYMSRFELLAKCERMFKTDGVEHITYYFKVPPPPRRKRNSEEREASPSREKKKSESRDKSQSRRKWDSEDKEMTPTKRKRNTDDREISLPRRERNYDERETSPSRRRRRTSHGREGGRNESPGKHEKDRRHSRRRRRSSSRDDLLD